MVNWVEKISLAKEVMQFFSRLSWLRVIDYNK